MLSYNFIIIVNYYSLMCYFPYVTCVRSQDRILLFRVSQCFLWLQRNTISYRRRGTGMSLANKVFRKQKIQKNQKKKLQLQLRYGPLIGPRQANLVLIAYAYRLCEQRRFRRACASAQSRQNLRCSLIQAVSQEEPSDRKPDPWSLWLAGHPRLKSVMTECSKTQIRLMRPN